MSTAAYDHEHDELIGESRARVGLRLADRDRLATMLIGGAFLAVAVPMALFVSSGRSVSPVVAALLVGTYALALRVEFEVGTGSAIPTQLVLVPMLFVLPIGTVPICVALGLTLGNAVGLVRGGIHLERVFLRLINSWHAVGPALVLAIAGERGPDWSDWPLYVGALGAQLSFDFASWSARDWLALGVSPRSQLRAAGWVAAVDAALAPVALLAAFAAYEMPYAFLLLAPLMGLLTVFARERRRRIDHALELSAAYRGTAFLLGDVVEADDAYTGSHSRDVVSLALGVCDELGVEPGERRKAEFAALLHDIGKIRIPDEIINKPGKLTPAEREVIETHTVEGEKLLVQVGGLLAEVGRIVRSCHERWDGAGYPDRIAGEEIPLVARIVCACDAFNAMTTDRPYRKARAEKEALEEMRQCAGTQFDPRVVDALGATIER